MENGLVAINSPEFRELLLKNNYSQKALAKKVRMSSGYLGQLIRGKRPPSKELHRKLIKAFDSPPVYPLRVRPSPADKLSVSTLRQKAAHYLKLSESLTNAANLLES